MAVVPDKVRDVGNYVYSLADTLRQALASATREVDGIVGASWTGTAADAFTEGWTETRTGGETILAALTTLAEKLGVTADSYARRDESNAAGFSASSLDLPGL